MWYHFRKNKKLKGQECKRKLEEFILEIRSKLNIDYDDYHDHILLLMIKGYYKGSDELLAYITFKKYNDLRPKFYCKLYKYSQTIDIDNFE